MNDKLDLVAKAKQLNRDSVEEKVKSEAATLGCLYFDLRKLSLDKNVLENFESKDFFDFHLIPLKKEGDTLTIATFSPNPDLLKRFQEKYKKNFPKIKTGLISAESFRDKENELKNIVRRELSDIRGEVDVSEIKSSNGTFEDFEKTLASTELQKLLKVVINEGFNFNASDIHIEPGESDAKIRFRIDGLLHESGTLTKEQYSHINSQVEVQSGLKLNVDYPQNGRFKVKFEKNDLSVRVEVMPSLNGNAIVIRIFSIQANLLRLDDLGIRDIQINILESALLRPHGMILVVGPTGSGKTTTIYSILNKINSPTVNLITLEDPIEYTLKGAMQSQINEGESFAGRLKAVLREDPDIIMLGEIRDAETAKTSLQAAITGHLLITTLHANDAVTAVPRLIGLVDDASSFLDALNIIIAQRLVRRICPNCVEEYVPEKNELLEINKILDSIPEVHKLNIEGFPKFFQGKGCAKCHDIGYNGRVGIYEFLKISPTFQKSATENATLHELKQIALADGMLSMEQDGILKAVEGIVNVGEVLKVIKE